MSSSEIQRSNLRITKKASAAKQKASIRRKNMLRRTLWCSRRIKLKKFWSDRFCPSLSMAEEGHSRELFSTLQLPIWTRISHTRWSSPLPMRMVSTWFTHKKDRKERCACARSSLKSLELLWTQRWVRKTSMIWEKRRRSSGNGFKRMIRSVSAWLLSSRLSIATCGWNQASLGKTKWCSTVLWDQTRFILPRCASSTSSQSHRIMTCLRSREMIRVSCLRRLKGTTPFRWSPSTISAPLAMPKNHFREAKEGSGYTRKSLLHFLSTCK